MTDRFYVAAFRAFEFMTHLCRLRRKSETSPQIVLIRRYYLLVPESFKGPSTDNFCRTLVVKEALKILPSRIRNPSRLFSNLFHDCFSFLSIVTVGKHCQNLGTMSRQYYGGAEAVDPLHHPTRSLPLSMPQPVRESPRSFPLSRQPNRSSPVADSESEKGSSSRKRISLAVSPSMIEMTRYRTKLTN